ncbi:MAG: S1 RNA-binding domain-containing protein [Candidatus Diapherotrites archaeon]
MSSRIIEEVKAVQFPEVGEVVVCKITKILDYGVFAELSEYEGVQGFVHISQVSSSWIKNIRTFVKEGQMRAAKVTNVSLEKNQVDLSFIRVSPRAQRTRIDEFKSFKRAQKLLEVLASQVKTDPSVAWDEVAVPLLEKYDSLHEAFSEIKLNKEKAAEGVSKKFMKPLIELIDKSIEEPKKTVEGTLKISSNAFAGVEVIKKAVKAGMDKVKGKNVEVIYLGSSAFKVKSTSFNYKDAEKNINAFAEAAVDSVKSGKGTGSFELKGK